MDSRMFRFARRGAVEYLEAEALAGLGFVEHAFCTRRGGVSTGDFSSLNAGFRVGDQEEAVMRNLARVGGAFAIPADGLVLMRQVHGGTIRVIAGDGPPPACVPECDGLITARPGVALAVKTADCVPLFFVDPVRRVIGAAHAGWRGTALGMAGRMVDALAAGFGSHPADLLAVIGPAVGPCCYQVDQPVRGAFAAHAGAERFLSPCPGEGRWMLDLALANRLQIEARGVPGGSILCAGLCTACCPDLFFSHRGSSGCTGRQVNLLMLRGTDARKNA